MGKLARGGITAIVMRWAAGLRFPWLFLLTAGLFALNVFIPDAMPLVDELLMGLVAALVAGLRKKPDEGDSVAQSVGVGQEGTPGTAGDRSRKP